MFWFKKKSKPKPEPKQETDNKKPGYYNSLIREGTPWPPIIRDDSRIDRRELFESIAEALNNAPKYKFIREKLEELVKGNTVDLRNGVERKGGVRTCFQSQKSMMCFWLSPLIFNT